MAWQGIRQSLRLHEELGDLSGLATAHRSHAWLLDHVGRYEESIVQAELHRMGEYERAIVYYGHALTLYREIGDRYNEVGTLRHLGDSHRAAGDQDAARADWQRALALVDEVDPATAGDIRDKLHYLDLPDLVGAESRVRRSCRDGP